MVVTPVDATSADPTQTAKVDPTEAHHAPPNPVSATLADPTQTAKADQT